VVQNLAVLARASVFSFRHVQRNVLDELHRAGLVVINSKQSQRA